MNKYKTFKISTLIVNYILKDKYLIYLQQVKYELTCHLNLDLNMKNKI